MTGRTLEEIEALAAEATPGPWWINPEFRADVHCQHGCIAEVIDFDAVHPDSFASEQQQLANAALISALPDLLAIAQGQRATLQEAKAAMRDMLCGWKAIRYSGGEDKIYGIGWDRAQAKVEAALDKIP